MLLILAGCACWDGSSPLGLSDVPNVSELDVVGLRAASDFETSGVVSLTLIPRYHGEPVAPAGLREVAVSAEDPAYEVLVLARRDQSPRTGTEIAGVILLDSSGSMSSSDPERRRVDASHLFIDRLESSAVPFTLAVFDFGDARSTPGCFDYTRILEDYTQDVAALHAGVESTIAEGDTPLFFSATEVVENLGLGYRAAHYRRVVLLLSDGLDNRGGRAEDVVRKARVHDVEIFAVSLGSEADEAALTDITRHSGGTTINVAEADELLRIFDGIAVTLSSSYVEADVRLDPIPASGRTVRLHVEANTGHRPVFATVTFTPP